MKKKIVIGILLTAASATWALLAQTITTTITGSGKKAVLAVPDFRGAGEAQALMATFNATLYKDLETCGQFDLRAKTMYPAGYPQQPLDLRPEDAGKGFALQDWAGAPTNASHLVFGYTAITNGVLALYGYVDDTRQPIQGAQLLGERLGVTPDEAGAIRLAHEFANDIIVKFGGVSLFNTHIYFVSNRGATGQFGTELWVMDWDGGNQRQVTFLKGQVAYPTISPDGSVIALTYWPPPGGQPQIAMINPDTGRMLPFYNQRASVNALPSFTPDGKKIFYSSSASGTPQIFSAGADGRAFTRITGSRGNPTEPKVNPKNPDSILFVDGFPNEQIYRMNSEGAGVERVTNGEGEASNPAWAPDGKTFAFAWTRGYQAGDFNIFVADIGSPQKFIQLTHGNEGKNENPVWAPDGIHIVFSSNRGGKRSEIYTMQADGSHVVALTNPNQGVNRYPVWSVK